MRITQKLCMDLARAGCKPIVGAVQGEGNTRALEIDLYDKGIAWELPAGATAAVAFQKPDGTKGLYDQLPNGDPATTISGSTVTAILAPQALTCAGTVLASVVFYDKDMDTLATFPFKITVEANPAAGEQISNNYYYLQNLYQANVAYAELLARLTGLEPIATDEQVSQVINAWLDAHPEATTTVQNGAVSREKLSTEVQSQLTAFVTPEMYGAVGDGVTDDSIAIQAAINSGKPVFFPRGTYVINSTISICNKDRFNLYAENACIEYKGTGYAFEIKHLTSSNLHFGDVTAENGGCIAFICDTDSDWTQYVNLYFISFRAKTNCIYSYCSKGWINEIRINEGAFNGGANGAYLVNASGGDSMNHWSFKSVGVEGVTTGFNFDAGSGLIYGIVISACRYAEAFQTLIKTSGSVDSINFNGVSRLYKHYLNLSNKTNMHIIAPMTENGGEIRAREAIVDRGTIILQDVAKEYTYLRTEIVDLRNLENPFTSYFGGMGIGGEVKKIYLNELYGRYYGINEFTLVYHKDNGADFAVYDASGNVIFNNTAVVGWTNLHFKWTNGLGWTVTKLDSVTPTT